MAWETGTADNHRDLLAKLVSFLTTNPDLVAAEQEWEVLRPISALPFTAELPNGRIGFDNRSSSNAATPDFWPEGIPASSAQTDPVVRMHITGKLLAPSAGDYEFSFVHGNWFEARIDGVLIASRYSTSLVATFTNAGATRVTITLTPGEHDLDIQLIGRGAAGNTDNQKGIGMGWRKPGDGSITLVPSTSLQDMVLRWGITNAGALLASSGTPGDFTRAMLDEECCLRGPGLNQDSGIFVNLYTLSGETADTYNLVLSGATGFSSNALLLSQPGSRTDKDRTAMLLWNQPMNYWFIANGRRFIIIAKASTTYESAYAGLGHPYALPSEFPYMLLCGASASVETLRYTANSPAHSSFWRPGKETNTASYMPSLLMRDTAGNWLGFVGVFLSSVDGHLYPINALNPLEERPSIDGSYALTPFVLYNGSNVYGEFEGVYHVSGFANSPESIITIEGQDYLVVQSGNRATPVDFAAIRLL